MRRDQAPPVPTAFLLFIFFTNVFIFMLCVYMYLPAHMYVHHVYAVPKGGQKNTLYPLELELYTGVKHHWALGSEPGSYGGSANALNS